MVFPLFTQEIIRDETMGSTMYKPKKNMFFVIVTFSKTKAFVLV
jgi:hypothetical protein